MLLPKKGLVEFGWEKPRFREDNTQNLRHQFAWMGCNLFAGPSGTWRLDDPGSAPEPQKPQSFCGSIWENMHAVARLIDGMVIAWEKGGDDDDDESDSTTRVQTIQITLGMVESFLAKLLPLIAQHDAHPFEPKDWVILDSDDGKWTKIITDLNHGSLKVKQAKQAALKFLNEQPNKVDGYLPIAHRNVKFAGAVTATTKMFWRLRKDNEVVPQLKMKANFQLQ